MTLHIHYYINSRTNTKLVDTLKSIVVFCNIYISYLHAICTKFIPHKILQIQPTITKNVTIWRKAASRFSKKAFRRLLILVLAPQNTVNDDINVPVNRNGIIRNTCFNARYNPSKRGFYQLRGRINCTDFHISTANKCAHRIWTR